MCRAGDYLFVLLLFTLLDNDKNEGKCKGSNQAGTSLMLERHCTYSGAKAQTIQATTGYSVDVPGIKTRKQASCQRNIHFEVRPEKSN